MSDSLAHCWAQPYIYRNLRFQDFATAAKVLWATGNKYNTGKYLISMDGKFICIIICIAICLISWICNSWIRILAGCLLCTAHCLWFPAYFEAFLSYCLLLLVFVVTRECACAMGQIHGALGPLGPSWPRAQGHGEGRREDGGGKAHRTKAMGTAKNPYHVMFHKHWTMSVVT